MRCPKACLRIKYIREIERQSREEKRLGKIVKQREENYDISNFLEKKTIELTFCVIKDRILSKIPENFHIF